MATFTSSHVSNSETKTRLKSSPPTVEQERGPSGAEALLYPTVERDSDGQVKIIENIITPSASHSRDFLGWMKQSETYGSLFAASPAQAHAIKITSPQAYKFAVDYQKGQEQEQEQEQEQDE